MKKDKIERICITYPPFENNEGYPLMSLNGQFQWLRNPSYFYPILPAYAATLLKNNGYNVFFLDTIARNMDTIDWFSELDEIKPQLIFFEARTPTINYTWDTIETIKKKYDGIYVVLAGDHVTSLPEESLIKSKADFIITGGNYEISLLSIVKHLNHGNKLAKGIYYRNDKNGTGNIKNTGKFSLDYPLDSLPFIDRNLTNWKIYSKKNEYFKKYPGTFIMSGRGSIYNIYNSNSSSILFNNAMLRSPINVVDEIEYLNKRYGIKEIIDGTICFPTNEWLSLFCATMRERKLNKKVYIDCYMYLNILSFEDFKMMKKSGFKTIIFNLPTINNHMIEKIGIDKNNVEQMVESIKLAKRAGLFIDMMVKLGYPNETEEDIIRTFNIVKNLMLNGYVNSMNVSLFVPYPNTRLFNYCKENDLLKTENWFDFDMRKSVVKLNFDEEKLYKYIEYFYNLSFNPLYLFHKITAIRDIYDIRHHINSFKNILSYYFK
ncbi:B12-binding domain-containing radical SAM protein [Brachyspira sp.]|uniref:B12-binding domain-containing radical SAM protein n=1 Tax=Brachyspira sp. TaxID=1977261 RepID=UPI003D7D0AE3